ncbi:MAG: NAD-dependent epimerase/dehydratase family protein [Deltaproteobacteria bacterium]|nr:NAD-dependent epimerase/dehydratase family protein [Deltaproteobacteria bacterium]
MRLEGLDAVIHLAGESVGEGRWTDERRHRIRDSRVEGTRFLAETLARLEKKPPALLAASAIGYYGDRGGEEMTEDSGPGEGFLPSVGVGWENATAPAAEAGIRVVNLRIGVVMTFFGAALPRIVSSTRFGASGKIGSGDQWVSWVSLDDLIGAIHYCLFRDISGPVNVVSPNPVQNRDLAKTVRGVLGRRGIFRRRPSPLRRSLERRPRNSSSRPPKPVRPGCSTPAFVSPTANSFTR